VTAPAPHKKEWVLAVSSDIAEFLVVLTLLEISLGVVRLYPGLNITKSRQSKYLMGVRGCKSMRKRGMLTVVVPTAGDRRVVDICLTVITSKPRFTNASEMCSAGAETGRCRTTAFIIRVRVTLRQAVYRKPVRLGAKLLETHGQNFFQLNTCVNSPYVTSF
jgi:hypothetical protein